MLATRIRRLSELMEDTVFLGLPSRLAKKLLSLARRYGKATPEGLRIELKLPQHELGELVGTSRESINKQLRQWGEEGIVQFASGYVTIQDARRGWRSWRGCCLPSRAPLPASCLKSARSSAGPCGR